MSTANDLALTIARYRDGELSDQEIAKLHQRLQADPEYCKAFTAAISDATSLDVHYANEDLDHHQACIADAISMLRPSQRLREVNRVQGARNRRRRQSPLFSPINVIIGASAAALLIGTIAFWGLGGINDRAPKPVPTQLWAMETVHHIDGNNLFNGRPLLTGDAQQAYGTLAVNGSVDISLKDGTQFQVSGPSRVFLDSATPLHIHRGHVDIHVAPQNDERFRVVSPHGEITVLGTQFALQVTEGMTSVALSEGTIETEASETTQQWQAPALIAMAKGEPAKGAAFIDIPAGNGIVTDTDWTLVDDPEAMGGTAWRVSPQPDDMWTQPERTKTVLSSGQGIELWVPALAGIHYQCWIRTKTETTAEGTNRLKHDSVALEFLTGEVVSRPNKARGKTTPTNPRLATFSGSGLSDTYEWIGGFADNSIAAQKDAVTIKFSESGLQRLRIVTYEGPLSIDRIRLVPEGNPLPK